MADYCFAWQPNPVGVYICKAIVERCDGQNTDCPFYKTEGQQCNSVGTAYARIASLPDGAKEYIADKYYRSEEPWRD